MKQKFYTLSNILKRNAIYNVIFGERSNGKTFAALKYGFERYWKTGEKIAYIRRWQDDLRGKRGQNVFAALEYEKVISKTTNSEWNHVYYYAGKWYLQLIEDGEVIKKCEEPFCYGFSLSTMEHDKSSSYPDVTTIILDEFMSRTMYLPDEFVLFMNTLSTIIRQRNNVKIFMLGNTVNKYCPYFAEMGLTHIKEMQPGDIDLYTYGESKLTVAVEYTGNTVKKDSDVYFAFNNPKLHMITGGAWEMDIYPHCPTKIRPKDIVFKYFIIFDGETLECDIVEQDDLYFTFVHRKTTPIKEDLKELIYTPQASAEPNYRRKITKPRSELEQKICNFYKYDMIFYQDNEVGEIVRNYLQWCVKN